MVANMDTSLVLAVLETRATESPSDTLLKLLSDPFHAQVCYKTPLGVREISCHIPPRWSPGEPLCKEMSSLAEDRIASPYSQTSLGAGI